MPVPDAAPPVLALDVGGTHIRMAIVDGAGRISDSQRIEARLSALPATADANGEVTRMLAGHIEAMLSRHPDIAAIGLGFPGFIHGGVVRSSPNIPGIADLPLAARLGERMGRPVGVENDAALAALGESRHGEDAPLDCLLHLTLGTGVGGGLVLNGVPYVGENGMAMEIGHLCVRPDCSPDRFPRGGRPCGCGNRGCLEAYASASSVAARWREASGADGARATDAREIHRRALEGDALARRILEEAGDCLGLALAQAVNLLDVRHVRVGGGMSAAWDVLAGPMRRALDAHLIPPLKGAVDVRPSRLGDHAALLGAASLARDLL